jgi:hypothetical protein
MSNLQYGDKRDYPKIDIYFDGVYNYTTTWSKTCKEAIAHVSNHSYHSQGMKITASFQK